MPEELERSGDADASEENESSTAEGDTIDEADEGADSEAEEEDDSGEEEEPKLKYARMTGHLAPVYRNGDATSAFLVAGDKMVWTSGCVEAHLLKYYRL